MKINEKHIAVVSDLKQIPEIISDIQFNTVRYHFGINNNETKNHIKNEFNKVFNKTGRKRYLLNDSAITVINTLKTNTFKPSYLLNKKQSGYRADYILNQQEMFKFVFDGYEWSVIYLMYNPLTTEIEYTSFKLIPEKDAYSHNIDNELTRKRVDLFVKCLMFIEFTNPEEIILKPNGKVGTRKEGKFKNETRATFVIISSKWNWISVRTQGFLVRGHFRWQPCGIKNQDRKLTFIEGFEKHGYTRKNKI